MDAAGKFLSRVERFLARHGISDSEFGRTVKGDPSLMLRLRKGRYGKPQTPTLRTVEKIEAAMHDFETGKLKLRQRHAPSLGRRLSGKAKRLYDRDFNAWLEEQAGHARTGHAAKLDLVHLAEELEGLNKSQRHEIENRLRVLLLHLLKHEVQRDQRSRSWLLTIAEQRDQIAIVLRDSPSLRSYPGSILSDAYVRAVRMAAIETGLPPGDFPTKCPWPVERVLEEGWLP